MLEQRTLGGEISYQGISLHRGLPSAVRLRPAPAWTGIVFRRADLPGAPEIPARVENVVDTRRCTVLGVGRLRLSTVEHVMAALTGMGVDNAYVDVMAEEVPVGDGSAAVFVDLIEQVGVVSLGVPRRIIRLNEPLRVVDGAASITAEPDSAWQIEFTFANESGHPALRDEYAAFRIDPAADDAAAMAAIFKREIAPARTIAFTWEIEALRREGLALGGSLDDIENAPAIVVDEDGVRTRLRFPDEMVRHKILDLIGDFGLLGGFCAARCVAIRSSHRLNHLLANRIRTQSADAASERSLRA